MKQSHLFTKTQKEAPTDEVSRNAELLIRGGFVHKELAGVYSYLPLGLRVLRKIENRGLDVFFSAKRKLGKNWPMGDNG